MEDVALVLVMLGLFAGIVVAGVVLGRRQIRRAGEQLRQLGERLGLQIHEVPRKLRLRQVPELRGLRRGKRVRVYSYHTGSGKSRTDYAAVVVTPGRRGDLTFRLSPQGFGSKLLTLFGAREIEVGDPDFDRRWFVQTNAPDFFRAALLPELRAKLNAVAAEGGRGTFEMVPEGVRYAETGWFTNRKRCERFVGLTEVTCDLSDVVEVHAEQPQS